MVTLFFMINMIFNSCCLNKLKVVIIPPNLLFTKLAHWAVSVHKSRLSVCLSVHKAQLFLTADWRGHETSSQSGSSLNPMYN